MKKKMLPRVLCCADGKFKGWLYIQKCWSGSKLSFEAAYEISKHSLISWWQLKENYKL